MQSINYNIDVVQGIVYLMGVAQSQAELNRVIEKARTIPDVKQVVSYVKLAGDVDQDFNPNTFSASEASGAIPEDFSRDRGGDLNGYAPNAGDAAVPFGRSNNGIDDGGSANGNSFPYEVGGDPVSLNRRSRDAVEVERLQ